MSSYRILPEALAELSEASMWYAEHGPELGLGLLNDFRSRIVQAAARPQLGAPAGTTPDGVEIRRFRMTRFKRYAILLAVFDDLPTVLAFEHSSRRPGYWRGRAK